MSTITRPHTPPTSDDIQCVAFDTRLPIPATPPRHILIAPSGTVASSHGSFVVDDEALAEIIATFDNHATDVPIDFEHQTLGGAYSAPDGLAPAAGWIRRLIAITQNDLPSADSDANQPDAPGLWAQVEWTPLALRQLETRQYRYLSPVAMVRRSDNRMIALHSAALTNKPAIVGMRPVVASQRAAERATHLPVSQQVPSSATSTTATSEPLALPLASPLALPDDARTDEHRTPRVVEALARLRGALNLAHDLPHDADESHLLIAAADRLVSLNDRIQQRAADDRVAEALRQGRLAASQRDWAHQLALRDPTGFDEWLRHAPQLVPLGRTVAPAASVTSRDTATIERTARDEYRRHRDVLARICTEDAWVADAARVAQRC